MRKLVVTENITVDGVIDGAGGWFDPAGKSEVDLSDLTEALNRQMTAADAFLVGRLTFEQMRSFWPKQTDDETGVSDYLNSVAKYVVSKTLGDPEWDKSTVLRGPLEEEIHRLKGQPGSDIVCTGSITLVHQLIELGLVDEYRLFVYPVVQALGRRLFESETAVANLGLVQTQPFRSGVVLLVYRVR
jgi:dihydrofolate reductase